MGRIRAIGFGAAILALSSVLASASAVLEGLPQPAPLPVSADIQNAPSVAPIPVSNVIVLAAANSSPDDRAAADFLANGLNDSDLINAALRTSAHDGAVRLQPGTYYISQIVVPTGASLVGAGRELTLIQMDGTGNRPGLILSQASQVVLEHFTVLGAGATGMERQIGIWIDQSTDVTIADVAVTNVSQAGLYAYDSAHLRLRDLVLTNIHRSAVDVGGVALWLFFGTHDSVLNDIYIEGTDAGGLYFDAGTNHGGARVVHDITATNVVIRDVGRLGQGAGVELKGAAAVSISNFMVDGTGRFASPGILFTENQNGIRTEDSVAEGGIILNSGGPAIGFRGTARCLAKNIRVHNVSLAPTMSGGYAVVFQASSVLAGEILFDTIDNEASDIQFDQGEDVRPYTHAVLFDAGQVGIYRNRLVDSDIGLPRVGAYKVVGSTAPVSGADANSVIAVPTARSVCLLDKPLFNASERQFTCAPGGRPTGPPAMASRPR